MDSLAANYASSDDDDEQQKTFSFPSKLVSSSSSSAKVSSLFSSLPQPKSSPRFAVMPQPKQQPQENPITKISIGNNFDGEEDKDLKKPASSLNKSSSIFSSLPQPKSQTPQKSVSVEKPTKKVVQFKPPAPIQSNSISDDEEDEDDEEKKRKKRKQSECLNQNSSVQSFLSSIPAPKSSATLGVLHSGSGSERRSIIETETPALSSRFFVAKKEAGSDQNMVNYTNNDMGIDHNVVNYANHAPGVDQSVENYTSYGAGGDQSYVNFANYQPGGDQIVQSVDASSYVNYGGYNGYGDYKGYGDCGHYGASAAVQETAVVVENAFRMPGKRGRKEIPTEIVEVEQDELIKNRPREDQVKLTGIAFGPSYQPVSTKGKPTKLHKRKHQIGSLYFDMKQKEMELAERRARGFQTKAQTQGKYGW